MQSIGARLRAGRLDAGMAQRDLALAVQISPSYLNLIEHDRRRVGHKLLSALAETLGLDAATLAEGADDATVDRIRAIAATRGMPQAATAQAEDLATRFAPWATLIAAQARDIAHLEQRAQVLSDRLTHDPALSTALHGVISAVTSIQSTAAILTGEVAVDADWQARFHRNILDDAGRLAATSRALVSYFDTPSGAAASDLPPHEERDQFLAQAGFHRPALEVGADDDGPVAGHGADPGDAHMMAAYDATYTADAKALPLQDFLPAAVAADHNPIALAAAFQRPLAQIMRRLASLPARGGGAGIGLAVCDASGVLTLLKPVSGFALQRTAPCPLWPIFTALGQIGRPVSAQVSMLGTKAAALQCDAVAEAEPHPAGPQFPPLVTATMLVRPIPSPQGVAVPAGPGCRLCARTACPARREPADAAWVKTFDT